MNDSDPTAAAIEADFGHRWRVWRSDTGRWWAARRTPPTVVGATAGCAYFLRADGPAELTRLIREQEQLQHVQQPFPTKSAEEPHE